MTELSAPRISRSEAKAIGAKRYFTGIPCKHGHLSERWVKGSCVACVAIEAKSERFLANQKRYRETESNKQIRRDQLFQTKYGITLSEYEALLAAQNNRCAICEVMLKRGRSNQAAAVDHCHPTGRVRGILCNQCNRGLGFFRDNAEVLRRALAYMKRGLS